MFARVRGSEAPASVRRTLLFMGLLDSGFERALELRQGEVIRWHAPATHRVGRGWVGGRIYLTDARFIFCPGVASRRRFETLRLPFAAITHIDVRGPALTLSDGGPRRRMKLTTAAGDEHTFSMPGFGRRIAELQALMPPGPATER